MFVTRPARLLPVLCFAMCSAVLGAQSSDLQQHERKAQEYLKARQPERARQEFEAIVQVQPQNLNAQANLGVLLFFAGKVQDAEPHLKAALALDPSQAKLRALLGFCERRNGEAPAAREDLREALPALTDAKTRKQAGLELVELDTSANDLPSAAATLTQLKAAMPTDPEVLYASYRVYTDLAGEAMLDLSLAAPDSAQMHQVMAHELVRERDNKAAIANLRQALAVDPHLPGAHYELAELLNSSSEPALKAEAPSQYKLALAENPRDEKALTKLGDLAAEQGDHEAAMAQYRNALRIQPDYAEALIGLAHELNETGHADAALPLLQKVVANDPTNVLAHFRLSVVYRRLHRPEDAKREVAEYERLKQTKEKLHAVYDALRMKAPQADDAKP